MTQLVDRTWPGCHLHFLLNILPGAEESRKQAEDSEELQVSAAEPKTPQQTERELQARGQKYVDTLMPPAEKLDEDLR